MILVEVSIGSIILGIITFAVIVYFLMQTRKKEKKEEKFEKRKW